MTPPELPIYYTTAEVALVLRETRENVSRRCKRGELPAKRVGRKYLISRAALDAFLAPAEAFEVLPPAYLTASHKKLVRSGQLPPLPIRVRFSDGEIREVTSEEFVELERQRRIKQARIAATGRREVVEE